MKKDICNNLNGSAETLLIPLWARAQETLQPDAIIKDEKAREIIAEVNYDNSKFKNADCLSRFGIAVRTMLLDKAVKDFINKNENAVIINMGAGLDTRICRTDNGKILWYDIDSPEVIEFRKNFFSETSRHKMIGKSVLDYSWIDEIDSNGRPLLFIVEGLLMYLDKIDVLEFMINIADTYPEAEMLFEILSPWLVKNTSPNAPVSKTTCAKLKWGVADGRLVADFYYKIRFIEQWNYLDFHKDRWGRMKWLGVFPWLKKKLDNHIVHVKFKQ
ncbi:MAG: class I SAM-dependent methyltransferase [Ignavibacteria bacterium]|jgi:O-methyltransferase involved in polyketide biosynthesis